MFLNTKSCTKKTKRRRLEHLPPKVFEDYFFSKKRGVNNSVSCGRGKRDLTVFFWFGKGDWLVLIERSEIIVVAFFKKGVNNSRESIWRCEVLKEKMVPNKKGEATAKLNSLGVDVLYDMVASGAFFRDIAAEIGVSEYVMLHWFETNHPKMYARARESRVEAIVEQTLVIADMDPGTTDNGSTDSGAVAHQRLRVDTRKWLASKQLPKKYGDSSTLDIGNKNDQPFQTQDLSKLSADELKMLLALRSKIGKTDNED